MQKVPVINSRPFPNSGWMTFLGLVLLIGGILALLAPFIAGIAAQLLLGYLFVGGGLLQLMTLFSARRGRSMWVSLLSGLAAVTAGGIMLAYPILTVLGMTLLIGWMFIIVGLVRAFLAYDIKPLPGWGWALLGAALDMCLGLLVVMGWPATALWTVGFLVGINFIHVGIGFLSLSSTIKHLHKVEQQAA